MTRHGLALFVLMGAAWTYPPPATIERIWLSHRDADPHKVVVNWETDRPADSVVQFGVSTVDEQEVRIAERVTLHQVEIPVRVRDARIQYRVASGRDQSAVASFKAFPTDVLRVAVVANWQRRPPLDAILREDVHLLLSAGDHISNLWQACGPARKECTTPYRALIDSYPAVFRSVPFMPALGNHDREIRPRGDAPPRDPVYDIEATAFRAFFALPGDEWAWHFDVPDFGVRFVALDLNHTKDEGTTWQSSHDFRRGSAQFALFRRAISDRTARFVVTISNERTSTVQSFDGGSWLELLQQGTIYVSGNSHFAEQGELDGVAFYNTSLTGAGDLKYVERRGSRFSAGEDNYLLFTFVNGASTMTAALKSLRDGRVLHRTEHPARLVDSPARP